MSTRWTHGSSDFYQKPAPFDPIAFGAKQGVQMRNAATGHNLFNQSHMPFGQHAGKMMERVPAHYYLALKASARPLPPKWGTVLDYIERHLHEIEDRALTETPPKEVKSYLYLPPDMDACRLEWGAMCGHGALAACLGIPVADTASLLGRSGWVNIPMMRDAITMAGYRFGSVRNGAWPKKGQSVVMIQMLGPWMGPEVPVAARCAYRHWIAVRDMIVSDKLVVWDANSQQWQSRHDWETQILPQILHPKATGWEVSIALCVWT